MTGVRIAATLGGFFGLMVFLVIYKSRGETQETMKALKVRRFGAPTRPFQRLGIANSIWKYLNNPKITY